MDVFNLELWICEFGYEELNLDKLQEYLFFIKNNMLNNSCSSIDFYTEKHHVVPQCLDKTKKYYNDIAILKASNHLMAHFLLVESFKCNKYRRSLGYAVRQMSRDPKNLRQLTPEEYEEVKKKFTEGVKGTKMTEETRGKISKTLGDGRLKGENSPRYGKHHTEEAKEKISIKNKLAWTDDKKREFSERRKGENNPMYGKKGEQSPLFGYKAPLEVREKLSLAGKGKIWITNGKISTKIREDDKIPEGWRLGRQHFDRKTNGQAGKIWIVNEQGKCTRIDPTNEIPEGYIKGKVWRTNHED